MKRFYLNNFRDTHRQGAIDALMGKDISIYLGEEDKVRIYFLWDIALNS